jgi:Flp pilus assembly protein TadD
MAEELAYTIGFDDVDKSLLPPNARSPGTEAFRAAITKVLEDQYRYFGGRVDIAIDEGKHRIDVTWCADSAGPSPADIVLDRLRRGDYRTAIPLLRLLLRHEPANAGLHYNLGMALSDTGEFLEAQDQLRQSLRLDPANTNAMIAIGVAQGRAGDLPGAILSLREAVAEAPDNPWAQRNLGGCLLQSGEAVEAETHLRRSVELAPDDQQALVGLGQTLEALGRTEEADELYIRAIQLGSSTPAGEVAKEARTRLAQTTFRKTTGGVERMDAVMYCLGALERFEKMSPQQIQQVGFEIALLGMRGLDTADSTQKYVLKTLPGKFSGLHLVSLMYVAFKAFAPDKDVGFDLSREYKIAKQMYVPGKGTKG